MAAFAGHGWPVQRQLAAQQARSHANDTPFKTELRPRSLQLRRRNCSLRASSSNLPPTFPQSQASSFSNTRRPDTSSRETRAAAAPEMEGSATSPAGIASSEYSPTPLDDLFLMMFRRKLVKVRGCLWHSRPVYVLLKLPATSQST